MGARGRTIRWVYRKGVPAKDGEIAEAVEALTVRVPPTIGAEESVGVTS